MKDDGIAIQIKQHKKFLKQRSVDRIIQTDLFSDTWDQANKKKRRQALKHIYYLDIRKLQLWTSDDFQNHSIRELRQIASHNHILNYCQLSKVELITILLKKGIKDGRDRETIKRNETNIISSKCSKVSNSNKIR